MATATIYPDIRKTSKAGLIPVKIRVTHKRKQKYYSTGYHVESIERWNDVLTKNPRGKAKIEKQMIFRQLHKAEKIISGLSQFGFNEFEDKFLRNKSLSLDVIDWFSTYENELLDEGRASTSASIRQAKKAFSEFGAKKKKVKSIEFGDIDKVWLSQFENWILSKRKSNGKSYSISTVGVYTRNLRTIFNKAIDLNVIPSSWSPFGRNKYVPPSSINFKRALTFNDIQEIYHYKCTQGNSLNMGVRKSDLEAMEKYKSFWLFSFLCQGVNFKDIASMKWEDYNKKEKSIQIIRQKTIRTSKANQKPIIINLGPQAEAIIKKYATKDSFYLFPFFTEGMDGDDKRRRCVQEVKNINRWMEKISSNLGLEFKVTFQYARHSYASIANDRGIPLHQISEALGHKNTKTTEKYIKSFDRDHLQELNNSLIDEGYRTTLSIAHKKEVG